MRDIIVLIYWLYQMKRLNVNGYLDSRCSFYMSHYKSLFYDNEYIDCGIVLIGNHNAWEIVGIGSIKIKIFDKITMPLEHVRHVLRLKKDFFFWHAR